MIFIKSSFSGSQGRNQRKISEGAEITFGNDHDVIDVQSTIMRPFCYDQLSNNDGGPFSNVGATSARQKN